jgi:hypothetical protein
VKRIILLGYCCLQSLLIFGQVRQRLQLPAQMHCLDDIMASFDGNAPGLLICNDIDSSRFVTGGAREIYMGKLKGPGIYTIREDNTTSYYFVFSCRDHSKGKSVFPLLSLPHIQVDSIDLAGVLDSLRVEKARGDSVFSGAIDSVSTTLSQFIDSGQVMKFGLFFDKGAGYMAITADSSKNMTMPDRDKLVLIADSFFVRFFRTLHPDKTGLNNQQLAVINNAFNASLPPGSPMDQSPNFRYSKYMVDDLLSLHRHLPVGNDIGLSAIGFENKFFGQLVVLFSIYKPPKVVPAATVAR